jgi:hypothetical protein
MEEGNHSLTQAQRIKGRDHHLTRTGPHSRGDVTQAHPEACQPKTVMGRRH